MKKFLFLFAITFMAATAINAQHKGDFNYKVRLGAGLSTFTNNDDAKYKGDFEWGVGFNCFFHNVISK